MSKIPAASCRPGNKYLSPRGDAVLTCVGQHVDNSDMGAPDMMRFRDAAGGTVDLMPQSWLEPAPENGTGPAPTSKVASMAGAKRSLIEARLGDLSDDEVIELGTQDTRMFVQGLVMQELQARGFEQPDTPSAAAKVLDLAEHMATPPAQRPVLEEPWAPGEDKVAEQMAADMAADPEPHEFQGAGSVCVVCGEGIAFWAHPQPEPQYLQPESTLEPVESIHDDPTVEPTQPAHGAGMARGEVLDAMLEGAATAGERIGLVKGSDSLEELQGLSIGQQSSVQREIDRQIKWLSKLEAARGDATRLQALHAGKYVSGRPGAVRLCERLLAELGEVPRVEENEQTATDHEQMTPNSEQTDPKTLADAYEHGTVITNLTEPDPEPVTKAMADAIEIDNSLRTRTTESLKATGGDLDSLAEVLGVKRQEAPTAPEPPATVRLTPMIDTKQGPPDRALIDELQAKYASDRAKEVTPHGNLLPDLSKADSWDLLAEVTKRMPWFSMRGVDIRIKTRGPK